MADTEDTSTLHKGGEKYENWITDTKRWQILNYGNGPSQGHRSPIAICFYVVNKESCIDVPQLLLPTMHPDEDDPERMLVYGGVFIRHDLEIPKTFLINEGKADQELITEEHCVGSVPFVQPRDVQSRPRPKWDIVQLEPLTLQPSIVCTEHPSTHGYITDGKWMDCSA